MSVPVVSSRNEQFFPAAVCPWRLLRSLVLLFCVATIVTASPLVEARKIALVIGNKSYKAPLGDIPTAAADAMDMANVLRAIGYDVPLGPLVNLNLAAFDIQVEAFADMIGIGDEVLVFYSGHAIEAGGLNFLLPVSYLPPARSNSASPELMREMVSREAKSLQLVMEKLRTKAPASMVIIVDACRNTPDGVKGSAEDNRNAPVVPKTMGNEFVLFAAAAGQYSYWRGSPNDMHRNSVFTRVLLEEIRVPGRSIGELTEKLSERVSDLIAKLSNNSKDQLPTVYGSSRRRVYLAGMPSGVSPRAASEPISRPEISEALADADSALWQIVESRRERVDYENYLTRFPRGRYAAIAEAILLKDVESNRAKRLEEEKEAWLVAEKKGDESGFAQFLSRYPSSKFAELAESRLRSIARQKEEHRKSEEEKIARESKQRLELAALREEDQAWAAAKEANYRSEYFRYLNRYPSGRYSEFARAAIKSIEDERIERAKLELERENRKSMATEANLANDADKSCIVKTTGSEVVLTSKYVGGCKDGLAHGYGEIRYSHPLQIHVGAPRMVRAFRYAGRFEKGMASGQGMFRTEENDFVFSGELRDWNAVNGMLTVRLNGKEYPLRLKEGKLLDTINLEGSDGRVCGQDAYRMSCPSIAIPGTDCRRCQ
jgi:hypothetical protein